MKTIVSKSESEPGKLRVVRKKSVKPVIADLKPDEAKIIAAPINTKWFLKKIINHYKGWFQLQFNK
jgi:hypothetical protein